MSKSILKKPTKTTSNGLSPNLADVNRVEIGRETKAVQFDFGATKTEHS